MGCRNDITNLPFMVFTHTHTKRDHHTQRLYNEMVHITINEQAATFPYRKFRNDFTLIFCYSVITILILWFCLALHWLSLHLALSSISFSLFIIYIYICLCCHHIVYWFLVLQPTHIFSSSSAAAMSINGCLKSIGVRFYSVCYWIAWQSDNNVVLSACHCTLMWISFQNTHLHRPWLYRCCQYDDKICYDEKDENIYTDPYTIVHRCILYYCILYDVHIDSAIHCQIIVNGFSKLTQTNAKRWNLFKCFGFGFDYSL